MVCHDTLLLVPGLSRRSRRGYGNTASWGTAAVKGDISENGQFIST